MQMGTKTLVSDIATGNIGISHKKKNASAASVSGSINIESNNFPHVRH